MTRKPEHDATLDHAIPPMPREEFLRAYEPLFDVGPPPDDDPEPMIVWPEATEPKTEVLLPSVAYEYALAVGAGLEEFGEEDLRIPQLKLRQAQTKNAERVPDGSWFVTSDLECHARSRELVFLEMRKERSLLLPYAGGDAADAMIRRIEEQTGVEVPADWEGPVCFSRDRVRPVAQEGIAPLAEDCASCPMACWRTVRGRRTQDCAESYRLLFFDLATQLPCVLYARGSAIRPTRDLLTNLQVASRRFKLPACGFTVEVGTKKIDSVDGTYFVPVFGRPQPVEDREEIAKYAGIRHACAKRQVEED